MDRIAPKDEAETANAVREAAAAKAPFEIVSGGTKRDYGRPNAAGTLLDMRALSGIVKYEPEELVLTARAGTPLAEIEAVLAENNQMLGFSPADWGPLFGKPKGRATLAGIMAANATGARRVKAGAARDHIIGCRFVNGMGDIVKAGGPVIKNVTGFDVPRLMCGAFGTLGVLTELTFRVSPAPARVAVLALRSSAKEGLGILREAARLPLDASGLSYIPGVYPPRDGAAELGAYADRDGGAMIRVEGAPAPVEDKLARLQAHFKAYEAIVLDDGAARALFRDIDDGSLLAEQDFGIWRLCVPPSEAFAALEASRAELWYADWAGGLLWLALPATAGIAARLREIAKKFGGHATLMRGSADAREKLPVFEPETPERAALTKSVKAAFDPLGLFNPGRMYKDI